MFSGKSTKKIKRIHQVYSSEKIQTYFSRRIRLERMLKWVLPCMLQLKDIFNLLGKKLKNRSEMAITSPN